MGMGRFDTWRARAAAFAETRRGKRLLKAGRWLFVGGVVALLAGQLTGIGWQRVWEGLPTTPWFYVIFLMMYFLLPAYEGLIYRKLWGTAVRRSFPMLVRKRVLNNDVVGYSGEVYLYWWGRRHTPHADGYVFRSIKDNAIASSLASTTALILLVGAFLLTGQVALVDLVGDQDPIYVLFGFIAAGVLVALGYRFRRTLFSLPRGTVIGLFATHLSRFVVMYSLQVLQWWVVLPEAPLRVWATMLVVGTLTSRIPFLPARDLFAIGAILGISDLLDASEAVIAGMLVVKSGLDKVFNFGLFALTSWWDRRRGLEQPKPGLEAPRSMPAPHEAPDEATVS